MVKVTAVLSSHNRRDATLACLDALTNGKARENLRLSVVLVDDGSIDGTADAVLQQFPAVKVLHGDGSLFWSRGMHLAQDAAMQVAPDFVLWVNDDTVLVSDAVERLLDTHDLLGGDERTHSAIVVGTTIDRRSGLVTYGGKVSNGFVRRFSYRTVWDVSKAVECEAMNGNVVLIPRRIYEQIGNVDPVFEHALGDIDYALRARHAGFRVVVAPGFVGYCSANMSKGTYLDPELTSRDRWRSFIGRKVLPPASWRHFLKRHAGWSWPLYFVWPYVNFAGRLFRDAINRRGANV